MEQALLVPRTERQNEFASDGGSVEQAEVLACKSWLVIAEATWFLIVTRILLQSVAHLRLQILEMM